jgi:hypothetical protein
MASHYSTSYPRRSGSRPKPVHGGIVKDGCRVPRDPRATERLNNPQATCATDLVGPAALPLPAPPAFASQVMAAEMTELYWLALMRDVPFREYVTHALASVAVRGLTRRRVPPDRRGVLVSG